MGTLLWIEALVRGGTEIGETDRRGGPMEPPIGYGSTHRSIFPESQFRKDGGSVFQGGRSWNNNLIDTSARTALEAIPGYTVTRFGTIKAFPVTALIQVITGTGIGGTEELWPGRSR
jgi:hypothetical protein